MLWEWDHGFWWQTASVTHWSQMAPKREIAALGMNCEHKLTEPCHQSNLPWQRSLQTTQGVAKLAYLSDTFANLNELNLSLQGEIDFSNWLTKLKLCSRGVKWGVADISPSLSLYLEYNRRFRHHQLWMWKCEHTFSFCSLVMQYVRIINWHEMISNIKMNNSSIAAANTGEHWMFSLLVITALVCPEHDLDVSK